jgi:hypothetical protein
LSAAIPASAPIRPATARRLVVAALVRDRRRWNCPDSTVGTLLENQLHIERRLRLVLPDGKDLPNETRFLRTRL